MQLVIRDECLNSEMLDRVTTIINSRPVYIIVDQFTDFVNLSATGRSILAIRVL